ncbi:hypothetical protein ABB37_08697 [Leptomonas pyrrhocoris]|uniref:Histone-lysine N-methyltransferase, H3 lysine-79 specific n=1 Tax=Leptomonas pyrrhocoris TaxID=157538 RepID=A0A0N0DSC9_LEPPY|nr:hypothetical protein ABB37_08697 [Leptomonas pyrrhocoris]XP_015653869.1 hypothetical protein ABB37_08697 [Leptomonas pyrrhocoris]XP_015653870.1 hypothetical protein ABB37_08697 [Leptomonas pyrrhocoris]KPA75429.1 hypothetical protein ABB37_08697 [Leptomonas pyrrhocoris]KPA75430.1 hypothetical protein ABB37_08697 [Leptomonas pyrrhocoris]KPA75431.1 hypothetical protein ABB37_08697 [Leptomonas pyrrhocoris]|eukprot:XP_015653868.1 hypothetical protein ABB37_08697 [Leptomonas pyrrhocoris]
MQKRLRRTDDVGLSPLKAPKLIDASLVSVVKGEVGDGSPRNPFRLPLRTEPNRRGCIHCTADTCDCRWFAEELDRCYASLSLKRETERLKKRELCAKSILPPFVARLIRIARVSPSDTFYDLGCGNGSVLFQVAALTGARCVGVEINPHNARLANDAWAYMKPILEKKYERKLEVQIVCGDFCELLRDPLYFSSSSVIWAANLLLPRPVNHFLSERLRSVPKGTRVLCFEDLYPHSRSLSRIRDPDAFDRFIFHDYQWQPETVEWCSMSGSFYLYEKRI